MELHGGDQRSAFGDLEAERARVTNGEVRHDLRETPDGAACFEGEGLIDRQMVDERGGVTQRLEAAGRRPRRIDHDAGAEFVVAAEIAVHIPGEHQRHHGSSRTEFADLQSAVVDEPLSCVCGNREHRGVHVGFADPNGHREYGSGDGVLRSGVLGCGHVATVMLADPGQVKIVEGNR